MACRPPRTARACHLRPSTHGCRVASCNATLDRARTAGSRQHTGRRRATAPSRSVGRMIKVSSAQLWVHDQEVAFKYWTEKVGMEVREDVSLPELGDFRWLAVGPPGQDDVSIVLMAVPGPPVMDDAT